jgi:galactonate dehydratase
MRITGVDTVVVDGGMRNWVLVQVRTDEGVDGLGEATLEGKAETIVAAVGELARLIDGHEPGRIQHLWQVMYRHSFWRGGPVLMSAISGIEQALWDIAGKRAGLPVFALLGGACRERIRLYANGPRGSSPGEYAESARRIADAGFGALKVAPLDPTLPVDSSATIRQAVDAVAAIREAVGPDVAIGIDVHGRLSPAMSIRFAKAVEALDIWFLEEPVLPENAAAMADVARATSIPIATGERLFTKWGFREVLELRAASLLQPDVSHCGGILEARMIAAMGEVAYAGLAPHNPLSPVNGIASAHIAMACPNFVALEWVVDNPAWTNDILTAPPEIGDGWLELSDAPGLGIELDLQVCAAHPYRAVDLPPFWHDDGAVADW